MAPSSVFLTFSWEISDNIIILCFCNIVEGQANCWFWSILLEFFIEHKPKNLSSELAALYASIVALAWYLFNKLGTQYGTTGLKDCLWTSISALRFEILNQLCNIWQHSIMTSWKIIPIKHKSGFDYSSWDESMIFLLV